MMLCLKSILILALFFISCDRGKNPASSSTNHVVIKRLSSIIRDDKLFSNYYYGTSSLLDSINYYDSTGVIKTHIEYSYINSMPVLSYVKYYNRTTGTTRFQLFRYVTQYNNLGYAVKKTEYLDSSDNVLYFWKYDYSTDNQVSSVVKYTCDSLFLMKEVIRYENNNLVEVKYHDIDDSLVGIINYTYDNKINAQMYSQADLNNASHNNALSLTSPSVNELGIIEFVIKNHNSTTITRDYSGNSIYTYDMDNYPLTQTATMHSNPPKVTKYEFKYVQN